MMTTITFYSFKGGVGRTMALANVAMNMVEEGKRVFVIDFDMEAPGLTLMKEFCPDDQREKRKNGGLFQYMRHYCLQGLPARLQDYILRPLGEEKPLYFLPAGDVEGGYNVHTIDFVGLCEYKNKEGKRFFDILKEKIEKMGIDYLLIDSRTGVSAYCGICLKIMPDAVVLFFGLNRQNIAGTNWAIENTKKEIKENKKILLIASPVPEGEEELKKKRMDEAEKNFEDLKITMTLPYSPRVSLIEERIIANWPDSHLALAYKKLYWKILELNPLDIDILMRDGLNAFLGKRLDETENIFREASIHHPDDKRPYEMLALSLMSQGKNEEAAEALKKAIKIDPNDAGNISIYASLLDDMARYDESKEYYKRAIEIEPKNANTLSNCVGVLKEMGQLDEAEKYIRKALNIDPKNAEFLSNYAILLYEMGRYDESEEYYNRAIEIYPNEPGLLYNYATFLMKRRRYHESEEYYKKALEIDPKNANVLSNYASLLDDMVRYDESEEYYKRALEIDPKHANALSNYASLLDNMGRYDESEEYYERAIDIEPKNANTLSNYKDLFIKMGCYRESEDYYKDYGLSP